MKPVNPRDQSEESSDQFVFKTKSQNLAQLRNQLETARVPELLHFSVQEWNESKNSLVSEVESRFNGSLVIARSSALIEDSAQSSLAGQFTSVSHINGNDASAVTAAIERVIDSMRPHAQSSFDDRILIQRQITGASMAGVVFSRDLQSGAPYYVVNYDDVTGRTDTVTSGIGAYSNHTLWVHRDSVAKVHSPRFRKLLKMVSEIERATQSTDLDIEFAVDAEGEYWLLQVRPLPKKNTDSQRLRSDKMVSVALTELSNFLTQYMGEWQGVRGSSTLLGQMPDWNPAEIIGRTPRRLARELYEFLITDSVWKEARELLGYQKLPKFPLMVSLVGQPFIDVRLSFNSFLPGGLEPELCDRIIDAWLDRLEKNPDLHDKIEFEIASTSYGYDLREAYEGRYPGLLSDAEFNVLEKALRKLTDSFLQGGDTGLDPWISKIDDLARFRANNRTITPHPRHILWHLQTCKELGTLPFAILARHAFVARELLLSLERRGALRRGYTADLTSMVKTVATDFSVSLNQAKTDDDFARIKDIYGHLRPGTYEVSSPRYDTLDFRSFRQMRRESTIKEDSTFVHQLAELQTALSEVGEHKWTAEHLLNYFILSTKEREMSKFVFTQTLSDVLEAIHNWASSVGLNREETSHLSLGDVISSVAKVESKSIGDRLKSSVNQGEEEYELSQLIRLPSLIVSPYEVYVVPMLISKPNFISHDRVIGRIVELNGSSSDLNQNLEGAIAIIENADPGFDWVFSRGIRGLITKYGGSNSHMAIRCSEFRLSAAIGCGEQLFESIRRMEVVELDGKNGIIRPVTGEG